MLERENGAVDAPVDNLEQVAVDNSKSLLFVKSLLVKLAERDETIAELDNKIKDLSKEQARLTLVLSKTLEDLEACRADLRLYKFGAPANVKRDRDAELRRVTETISLALSPPVTRELSVNLAAISAREKEYLPVFRCILKVVLDLVQKQSFSLKSVKSSVIETFEQIFGEESLETPLRKLEDLDDSELLRFISAVKKMGHANYTLIRSIFKDVLPPLYQVTLSAHDFLRAHEERLLATETVAGGAIWTELGEVVKLILMARIAHGSSLADIDNSNGLIPSFPKRKISCIVVTSDAGTSGNTIISWVFFLEMTE